LNPWESFLWNDHDKWKADAYSVELRKWSLEGPGHDTTRSIWGEEACVSQC